MKTLPAHLAAALEQRQNESEILIGWVQLIIVAVWSTMYLLSPKAYPADAMIVPVPWALGCYLLFTLSRLWLAYRNALGTGVLVMSVVIDIALLLLLVLSFHIQYMQPPAFSLKIPTMMYLFVFISIRALRFEASYVILAGIVACIGWLLMVIYATIQSPEHAGITRDFVQYMTDNRILIGAEIDKIITIAAVTAVLALAITRARRMMIDSLLNRATASNLSRFVPIQVARQIEREGESEAGQVQTREASILFVDIEGFTSMGERMAPERLIASLNEYFALVVAPIENSGGTVTQFQGDAILASFNLPATDPDHASRAVEAGVGILSALENHQFSDGQQYRVRIGISTGSVTGGLVGVTDRVSYTVHGDAVNLAARLEQLNKTMGTRILIAAATQAQLRDFGWNIQPVDTVDIRGRMEAEPVYTVNWQD